MSNCWCTSLTCISLASFFVGHRPTMQTQIRIRWIRCLIGVFTDCLLNVLLKFAHKNWKIPLNTPTVGNKLVLLIRVGKSIQLKWVKHWLIVVVFLFPYCVSVCTSLFAFVLFALYLLSLNVQSGRKMFPLGQS